MPTMIAHAVVASGLGGALCASAVAATIVATPQLSLKPSDDDGVGSAAQSLPTLAAVVVLAGAEDDRKDIPNAVYDKIKMRIARQTTFLQLYGQKVLHWAPRSIDLIKFVKTASPTYERCHFYAMIWRVTIASDEAPMNLQWSDCVVTLVFKDAEWNSPTVVCQPTASWSPRR